MGIENYLQKKKRIFYVRKNTFENPTLKINTTKYEGKSVSLGMTRHRVD